MKKLIVFMVVVVAAGLVAMAAAAANDVNPAEHETGASMTVDRVEALLAMSPAERRAYIKALDPAERHGLVYEVRRAQALRQGIEPKVRGTGMTGRPLSVTPEASKSRAVGTIQYDSGVATTSFGGGAIIGNRFDTHTGMPVLASGTVSTVQAVVVPGPAQTTSNAFIVILGPQTGGGGAQGLFSSSTVATGTVDTVTFSGLGVNYTGSSFFAVVGDFANSYVPAFGTGTNLGQGRHGMVGYTGGQYPDITSTFDFGGTLNGLVRAGGNIVPVELMSFDAE